MRNRKEKWMERIIFIFMFLCTLPVVLFLLFILCNSHRHDVPDENIETAWVPGAFEIPLIASKMAKSGKYDAIICLGAVIRGSTSHYDYVCSEVSKGIAAVSLQNDIPVMFGVLTTENIEQAIERAGTKAGNKGFDCATGAIEMVNLMRALDK